MLSLTVTKSSRCFPCWFCIIYSASVFFNQSLMPCWTCSIIQTFIFPLFDIFPPVELGLGEKRPAISTLNHSSTFSLWSFHLFCTHWLTCTPKLFYVDISDLEHSVRFCACHFWNTQRSLFCTCTSFKSISQGSVWILQHLLLMSGIFTGAMIPRSTCLNNSRGLQFLMKLTSGSEFSELLRRAWCWRVSKMLWITTWCVVNCVQDQHKAMN